MSVIVNDNTSIDVALRQLWREANREGIFEKLEEIKYYIPKTKRKHEKQKKFIKSKKRRRKLARMIKSKVSRAQ